MAVPDLVNSELTAAGPNRVWVADITYIRIPTGFCYTAFITDVCTRKIVGWSSRRPVHTQALRMQTLITTNVG